MYGKRGSLIRQVPPQRALDLRCCKLKVGNQYRALVDISKTNEVIGWFVEDSSTYYVGCTPKRDC